MNEFDVIAKYFTPLTMGRAEALDLTDDAAILAIPEGFELVISTDTLCENIHFHADEPAANIAHKALRANLSDIAAMGATPHSYQLSLAFAQTPDPQWLESFTAALLIDNAHYDIFCSGGDTTLSKSTLIITITMFGLVPRGKAIKRSGAKAGDLVVVTGEIGRARASNYRRIPTPRTDMIDTLQKYATAAIDISDGLLNDLGHICKASNLGATVELAKIPITKSNLPPEDLLGGGDDYELLFAIPPQHAKTIIQILDLHIIGQFTTNRDIIILDKHKTPIPFNAKGWTHF